MGCVSEYILEICKCLHVWSTYDARKRVCNTNCPSNIAHYILWEFQTAMVAKNHNAPRKEVHSIDIIELIPYHYGHVSQVENQQGLWFKVSFLLRAVVAFLLNAVIIVSCSFIQISRIPILTSYSLLNLFGFTFQLHCI